MSTTLPTKPRNVTKKSHISLVVSRYNEKFTEALVDNTRKELNELMPNSRVEVIYVPGAFEVPVTVAALLKKNQSHAIIALGLIIRGETKHGDLVAESVTNSLQNLAVQHCKPVIHEVLLVNDEKQAYARCIGSQLNRGVEAARAATVMLDLFEQFQPHNNGGNKLNQRQYPSNA